jgi:hypothetical protein
MANDLIKKVYTTKEIKDVFDTEISEFFSGDYNYNDYPNIILSVDNVLFKDKNLKISWEIPNDDYPSNLKLEYITNDNVSHIIQSNVNVHDGEFIASDFMISSSINTQFKIKASYMDYTEVFATSSNITYTNGPDLELSLPDTIFKNDNLSVKFKNGTYDNVKFEYSFNQMDWTEIQNSSSSGFQFKTPNLDADHIYFKASSTKYKIYDNLKKTYDFYNYKSPAKVYKDFEIKISPIQSKSFVGDDILEIIFNYDCTSEESVNLEYCLDGGVWKPISESGENIIKTDKGLNVFYGGFKYGSPYKWKIPDETHYDVKIRASFLNHPDIMDITNSFMITEKVKRGIKIMSPVGQKTFVTSSIMDIIYFAHDIKKSILEYRNDVGNNWEPFLEQDLETEYNSNDMYYVKLLTSNNPTEHFSFKVSDSNDDTIFATSSEFRIASGIDDIRNYDSGSLTITTTFDKGNGGPTPWYVNYKKTPLVTETPYRGISNSETLLNMTLGTYDVIFGDISNYITPQPVHLQLNDGFTATIANGEYKIKTGYLSVDSTILSGSGDFSEYSLSYLATNSDTNEEITETLLYKSPALDLMSSINKVSAGKWKVSFPERVRSGEKDYIIKNNNLEYIVNPDTQTNVRAIYELNNRSYINVTLDKNKINGSIWATDLTGVKYDLSSDSVWALVESTTVRKLFNLGNGDGMDGFAPTTIGSNMMMYDIPKWLWTNAQFEFQGYDKHDGEFKLGKEHWDKEINIVKFTGGIEKREFDNPSVGIYKLYFANIDKYVTPKVQTFDIKTLQSINSDSVYTYKGTAGNLIVNCNIDSKYTYTQIIEDYDYGMPTGRTYEETYEDYYYQFSIKNQKGSIYSLGMTYTNSLNALESGIYSINTPESVSIEGINYKLKSVTPLTGNIDTDTDLIFNIIYEKV